MMENYGGDYYTWLNTTAQAIEQGRLSAMDQAQVAEELRDMGKSERRSIESFLERILVHLLKIEHQPGKHTRSWDLSIQDSRVRLRKLFRDDPSLRPECSELIREAYETARLTAAGQTGLDLDVFPEQCPYSVADVVGE